MGLQKEEMRYDFKSVILVSYIMWMQCAFGLMLGTGLFGLELRTMGEL